MTSPKKPGRLRTAVSFLLIFHLFMLSLGWAAPLPQWRSMTFQRGDALRLTIWQPYRVANGQRTNLEINGDYSIDSRGYAFFPLIGEVKVVGHNPESLARLLREEFSPYFQDHMVVVKPLIRVSMQGAFNRPGTYLAEPDASLWELVDLAGGPSENSDLKGMVVERGGEVVIKNLLGSFERGYSLQEIGIQSGDQILLPNRGGFRVRDAFEILRFGISILQLYILIERVNNN